jgi:hypothetical protein
MNNIMKFNLFLVNSKSLAQINFQTSKAAAR